MQDDLSPFFRTELLLGKEKMNKIQKSHIAVFGIGGVGSFATEAIVRCGVQNIDIFDGDTVDITNINRQIMVDVETIGQKKTEVMKERIKLINPNANVNAEYCFFDKENKDNYDFSKYEYIVDAIDTVTSKILLIEKANQENVNIISCMGTGNQLCPEKLEVSDIYKTSVCPLARVMRRELKKRNIKDLKGVYSEEEPSYVPVQDKENPNAKRVNASISFVPSVAGLIIASEVIKDISKIESGE